MNKELQALIKDMRAGLRLCPTSIKAWQFSKGDDDHKPIACCPLAHASLGRHGSVSEVFSVVSEHPILHTQMVLSPMGDEENLELAIEALSGNDRWTTEQVIGWLRSHLKD